MEIRESWLDVRTAMDDGGHVWCELRWKMTSEEEERGQTGPQSTVQSRDIESSSCAVRSIEVEISMTRILTPWHSSPCMDATGLLVLGPRMTYVQTPKSSIRTNTLMHVFLGVGGGGGDMAP